MKKLAFSVSVLLHPLLLPLLTFILIFQAKPFVVSHLSANIQNFILLMSGIAFTFPVILIGMAYLWGLISSLELKDRQERIYPFMLTVLVYAGITYFLYINPVVYEVFPLCILIFSSVTVSITLVTAITFFWKISAHSVGICGVLGFLLGISYKYADTSLFYPILLSVFLAGLLMSARLYLNAHTPEQVFSGACLGFWVSFFSIIFFA